MKASFTLKSYNTYDISCYLIGNIGNNVVTLQINDPKGKIISIELSASELIIAASRLSAGPDGLCPFPEGVTKC